MFEYNLPEANPAITGWSETFLFHVQTRIYLGKKMLHGLSVLQNNWKQAFAVKQYWKKRPNVYLNV